MNVSFARMYEINRKMILRFGACWAVSAHRDEPDHFLLFLLCELCHRRVSFMARIVVNGRVGRRKPCLGMMRMLHHRCKFALLLSTATSYYVQERRGRALDGEGDMERHYSTRDFFRQMPSRLLARYFQGRVVLGDLDFAALKDAQPDKLFAVQI